MEGWDTTKAARLQTVAAHCVAVGTRARECALHKIAAAAGVSLDAGRGACSLSYSRSSAGQRLSSAATLPQMCARRRLPVALLQSTAHSSPPWLPSHTVRASIYSRPCRPIERRRATVAASHRKRRRHHGLPCATLLRHAPSSRRRRAPNRREDPSVCRQRGRGAGCCPAWRLVARWQPPPPERRLRRRVSASFALRRLAAARPPGGQLTPRAARPSGDLLQ